MQETPERKRVCGWKSKLEYAVLTTTPWSWLAAAWASEKLGMEAWSETGVLTCPSGQAMRVPSAEEQNGEGMFVVRGAV